MVHINIYPKTLIAACTAAMAIGLAMTSCMGDEPAYCEADIESVTLHVDAPGEFFFQLSDSLQSVYSTDSVVNFAVRGNADVTALVPVLTLSPGATVSPASGSVHDFSQGPVAYTVTSQDGQWRRKYLVSVTPQHTTVDSTLHYDFEHYELEPTAQRYYIWHNVLPDGSLGNDWSTANAGYKLSMGSALPEAYPTTPLANGYDGAAVCLTTSDTGPFGRMANKRLAAGNMFIGTFDVQVALSNHLEATRFGLPFTGRPTRFKGYYTYQPGPTVQDFYGNPIAGRIDSAAVYAVFYRNHDAAGKPMTLSGADILTSPNIVALARLYDVTPTSEWTPWDVEFVYREEIDEQLLANRGYSLAIVFSSSLSGDIFVGAIGSRLCIDKVSLTCTREE